MDDRVGFTVEREPARRPLRWRLPALVLVAVGSITLYWLSRPAWVISGQYEGYVGGAYSSDKTHLQLRLVQNDKELKGDCLLTRQRGRVLIRHTGILTGQVSAHTFTVRGPLDDGQSVVFTGAYVRTGSKGQLQGQAHYERDRRSGGNTPFLARYHSPYSPKDLIRR
jgi:hypothetical protein